MARLVTRSELATRIRARAKMESSDFASEAELNTLITEAVAELFDLLVSARGQEYYRSGARLFTTPGMALYELPPNFYKSLAVSAAEGRVIDSHFSPETPTGLFFSTTVVGFDDSRGQWLNLDPFSPAESAALRSITGASPFATRYRLSGLQLTPLSTGGAFIELRPTPSVLFTVQLDYIPVCNNEPDSGAGEITWDGINGFEEYVVLVVARELLGEEESNTAHLDRSLARVMARIESLADSRDAGRPEKIQDTTGAAGGLLDLDAPRRPLWWGGGS